jgi:hypothetical protein
MVAAKANPKTRTQAAKGTKAIQAAVPKPPADEDVSSNGVSDLQPELFESKEPEPQAIRHFGPPKGVYPDDAELFSYTSKHTGETIWFPMKFEQPKFSQVWEIYDQPWHVQTWEYMRWAKIPKVMQRKAAELFDVAPDEYLELFNSWMKAVGGLTLGE